jgi:hypothetical protein
VAEVHAAAEPLKERLESSPVIGWLKAPDGRYLYINQRYVEQLGASAAQVVGCRDAELEPRQAIDGPRLQEGAAIDDEPIRFEYRVSAFDGRPALAVMRFPVRDPEGNVVAVCGIATADGEAHVARSECADLIALEAGRAPIPEHDRERDQRRIAALHEASATAARRAHELLTALTAERETNEQLRRELDGVRSRLGELEHLCPPDPPVGEELNRIAAELQRVTDELDRARQRAAAAEAETRQTRQRAAAAETGLEHERQRAERAEHTATTAVELADRLRVEISVINEALEQAERTAAEQAAAAESAAARAAAAVAAIETAQPTEPQIEAVPDANCDDGPHWSAAAQRTLTASLANASEWRIGLRDVVKVLGREAGWDAVCAWVPDERGRQLRCAAMWSGDGDGLAEFETRTWQQPQSLTTSVLGRSFAAREVTRLTEIGASDDNRLQTASAEGMTSAVLVPIHSGRSGIGLLELLCRHELRPDAELAAAMDGVALQLGHFWHLLQLGAQPHWRLGRL